MTDVPEWSTALPDWEERIVARRSLVPCAPLFPAEAAAARAQIGEFRIVDAPGSPTMAKACLPWVFDFIDAIFGAYDAETGRRLIRDFFLLISKKNTKSTTAAAIMLEALIRNWRNSAEYIILAPTKEIANNDFGPARDMIRTNKELSALCHVQEHLRMITHRVTGATLKVLAADSETVGGKKATGVLVEELWLFGKQANAENMLREATGGLASRPEGFVIYLSTQSDDPPAGVFKQKLGYARDVRDGKIVDRQFLPILYEFPERMLKAKEYLLKKNFYVTNPNLGVSVDEAFLSREYDKAQQAGEASLRGFLAKHLNVEIGLALRSDRWAGADSWEAAAEPGLTLDAVLERSEVVTVGVDGGGADDLLGLAVLGREKDTRRWLLWAHAWAHPKAVERRKENASRYRDFKAAGELTIINDYPEDLVEAVAIIERVKHAGLLAGVGLDMIGIMGIVDALAEIDVTEDGDLMKDGNALVGVTQGYRLAGSIKGVERKLIDGSFRHCGQALMAWSVGNAKVEATRNAFIVTKQASGMAKIDPLMAMFDAATLMERNPPAMAGGSIFDREDLAGIIY